jgi:ABC-type transporter Mla MlaB component
MALPPPHAVTVTIRAPLDRDDLPGLFQRTCALLEGSDIEVLLCDATGVAADAVAVDALARLTLAALRNGCRAQLCGASAELRTLVSFMGLAEVLGE